MHKGDRPEASVAPANSKNNRPYASWPWYPPHPQLPPPPATAGKTERIANHATFRAPVPLSGPRWRLPRARAGHGTTQSTSH